MTCQVTCVPVVKGVICPGRTKIVTMRFLDFRPYALLLTINSMYIVLRTQHWHPAVVAASLAAFALVGAALMSLAERYRAYRLGKGDPTIPAHRCAAYALTIVAIASVLTTSAFVLPPLVFAFVLMAGGLAMTWAMAALERLCLARFREGEGGS